MKCANCGAEVAEGIPFCSECGRPMTGGARKERAPRRERAKEKKRPEKLPKREKTAAAKPEKKPKRSDAAPDEKAKKPIKWKRILILVLIAAILIAAAVAYFTMPALRLQRAMTGGDPEHYAKAAEIYTEDVRERGLQRWLAGMLCRDHMQDAADAYFAGDLTYEEATAFYHAFDTDDSETLQAAAQKQLKRIESDHVSRKLLAEGDAALKGGDYFAAIAAYEQIPTNAAVYQQAQTGIAEARRLFVSEVCDAVDKQLGRGEYAEAMQALNEALEKLPEDETLLEKQKTVGTTFEAITLDQVSDLMEEKDYAGAADVLNAALELMPDSKKLADKLEEVEKAADKAASDKEDEDKGEDKKR